MEHPVHVLGISRRHMFQRDCDTFWCCI